ncbi:MAG: HDOD domain-containing protein [Desulfosarcina sp.]|nr:HDOD domain-containing protein [Desulfosarcina sp.]MBC2743744.1 HDOD domain-containing protein [Desulfosarcina sp.]MBC2766653.1 HDOD domain-containing protein [Desulfosarcina sp.]
MELAVAVRAASEFTGRVQLSVFPYLLERLINARHEPDVELPSLSRFIKMDPALCFMAMRLDRSMGSNSQSAETPSVDEVISRIGITGIDAITAQALANQVFSEVHHRQGLSLAWLWRHCLTTALLAQRLALELNFRPVADAYIAGLLHDIGKLALSAQTPVACAPLLADPTQANPLLEAEAQVAGSDHGRIGAWLIRRYTDAWFAADAARYHTAPALQVKNALPLVQIVWAANRLANESHPSSGACQTAAKLLNLDPQELNRLSRTAVEQALAVADELGVPPDVPEKGRHSDENAALLNQKIKSSTILSSVYGELLAATDSNAIIRVLRQSLSVLFGIDTLLMFAHEPQNDLLVGRFAAGRALPGPADRLRIPLIASDSLPAICHISGEPVDSFSRSSQRELTIIDHQLMEYMGKDGIVCLPVRSGIGGSRGCLLLGIDGSDWPLVKKQADLLKAIAATVAGALERERQRQEQIDRQAADCFASTLAKTRKIVHEINNPLSIIKNYLKVLALRTDKNPSGIDELRIINEEINRVAGLIKSLTSPSEKIPKRLETVDVNAMIADILGLFRRSLSGKKTITLNQDLDARIPAIATDRDLLKQALMNLLKNAAEAMPDGGTITVSTRMSTDTPRYAGHSDGMGHIKISICDDGPGIDEQIKEKLFTPYVTSKTGHDGLGLPIAHEAVLRLKGSLLCESAAGGGTCFFIELPVGDDGPENPTALDSAT